MGPSPVRDLTDEQRRQRREAIAAWLDAGFNATKAARSLGRDPATFYRWVTSVDLDQFRANVGRRVLFVDDQSYKMREVEDSLLQAGLFVDLADNGPTALELIERRDYACIITDQMMEGMDGLELCELILERRPNLPIVLLTAYPDFALCRHAMREGLVRDVVPWSEFGENPVAFGAEIVEFARSGKHAGGPIQEHA
jgi:CheY-like chemotaxis protein